MASSEQVKSLIKSHIEGDERQFFSVAMQIAANSAKKGHERVAKELRDLIDEGKKQDRSGGFSNGRATRVDRATRALDELLEATRPETTLQDMVLSEDISNQLQRVITEQYNLESIKSQDLQPRRKLLLVGPPGCGKTMTAESLAGELGLPLYTIRLDGLISKYMGESVGKLNKIFQEINKSRGVYLFDEFDSIGGDRSNRSELGEIHRVLSTFLMMIEKDASDSLIISATNQPDILDKALFRRFDDIIEYKLPNKDLSCELISRRINSSGIESDILWDKISKKVEGLSFAEISDACDEAIKDKVIGNKKEIKTDDLLKHISNKKRYK